MTKKIPDILKSAAAEKALEANAKFKEASLSFAVCVCVFVCVCVCGPKPFGLNTMI